MIKLLNLDPVLYATTKEEEAYIGKYLSKDTVLESRHISHGPQTIETEYEEALSQPMVIEECIRAEKDGFDGIFIDCFGDPGVHAAREVVDIPVYGGFEPVVHLALGLADRIAIVTVVKGVMTMVRRKIAAEHLQERIVDASYVDMPVMELTDHDKLVRLLVEKSIWEIKTNDVQAIVLGCTAMIEVAERVKAELKRQGYDIPVLEAAQVALMTLEMQVKMGITHSREAYIKKVVE